MLPLRPPSPFGSRSRSRILLALSLIDFSYPRALARLLDVPVFAVRKALDGLARDGLVVARSVGRTRVYRLDPSYPAHQELAAYLARLAELDTDVRERVSRAEAVAGASPQRGFVPPPAPPAAAHALEEPGSRRDDSWKNW